jgi:hypothetical protein
MKKTFQIPLLIIASLCLLAIAGRSIGHLKTASPTAAAARDVRTAQVKEIAGYRSWTKVNTVPQLMPDRTAQLCADVRAIQRKSPHDNKYLTVYVNELGRRAMLEQVAPSFPEGSVIVKEKLAAKDSDQPELMTVMIKRAKGFNPANGDWEYMVVDGTGTTVQAQGNLENCQSCHSGRPGTDYVFRTYLSDEAMKKLK